MAKPVKDKFEFAYYRFFLLFVVFGDIDPSISVRWLRLA
jgi:hypothetical protein